MQPVAAVSRLTTAVRFRRLRCGSRGPPRVRTTSMSPPSLTPGTSSTPANVKYVILDLIPTDAEEERDARLLLRLLLPRRRNSSRSFVSSVSF